MNNDKLHIIMPVKDSLLTAEEAIRAICSSGHALTVYDDYSLPETVERLDKLMEELPLQVLHLSDMTDHPSPNYRTVLIHAQQQALAMGQHLLIVESDVIVAPDTIDRMLEEVAEGVGLVAAVTHDADGLINFPYQYARRMGRKKFFRKAEPTATIHTTKRLSFCCTLLSLAFLQHFDFNQLDPEKNWYDVFISHQAVKMGYRNLLMLGNPVLHKPHSSRPWKQLKYSHPLKYYFLKLLHRRDKI